MKKRNISDNVLRTWNWPARKCITADFIRFPDLVSIIDHFDSPLIHCVLLPGSARKQNHSQTNSHCLPSSGSGSDNSRASFPPSHTHDNLGPGDNDIFLSRWKTPAGPAYFKPSVRPLSARGFHSEADIWSAYFLFFLLPKTHQKRRMLIETYFGCGASLPRANEGDWLGLPWGPPSGPVIAPWCAGEAWKSWSRCV